MEEVRPTGLAQLQRRSLRSDAADAIRAAIVSGELREGTRVNESHLSTQLGISRGPIREALRELEQEGRLVSRPNYGTYVAQFSLDDLVEAISVRELLEPFVMERSLQRANRQLLEGLRNHLGEMEEAARNRDRTTMVVSHDEFHAQFYAHADHRLILSIYDRVRVPLQSHVRLQEIGYRAPEDMPTAHRKMLDLAEANDPASLRTEILAHLRMNLARFTEVIGHAAVNAATAAAR